MNKKVMLVVSGGHPAGLAFSYKRAMEAYGLEVSQFDLEQARAAIAPLGPLGHRLMRHVDLTSHNARANRVLVRTAMDQKPAVVIVIGVEPVRPATLLQLKISVPGVKIVNIFPDMLFNVKDAMFPSLPLYDLFACHTRAGVPFLKQAGCAGAFYLPLAADPTLHRPEALTAEEQRAYGCELVFAGTPRPEHAALFARLEGFDLAIWGMSTWKDVESAWVRSRWRGRAAQGADYAKVNRAAKICLNPIDPLDVPGHNMRVFELPACGVFSLVTRTEEVLEIFREGESVVTFATAEELVDKVRHYLGRPEERQRIAAAAHERVIHGGHTYRDRVRTLFGEIGLSTLLG